MRPLKVICRSLRKVDFILLRLMEVAHRKRGRWRACVVYKNREDFSEYLYLRDQGMYLQRSHPDELLPPYGSRFTGPGFRKTQARFPSSGLLPCNWVNPCEWEA